ncbi:LOW QUALITY PROTEIN: glyoxylase I 4 [Rosa rugosa]|uniref:LOW QUALITY PROTEIN: glyoxylase I 4 n=1 Tax=Rosa rugosa TaxID=74645 RepID=UPI002B41413E|nr:LOW QUALITY PROTEIN: glyoxylase I 4 [Rosa rugosa]
MSQVQHMKEEESNGQEKKLSTNEENQHKEKDHERKDQKEEHRLPLMALNHVSRLCRNVESRSVDFYTKMLGFVKIERPPAFDFDGAWLFNMVYGVGIHLVQSKGKDRLPDQDHLDPMDNHISFQCEDMDAMVKKLEELNIEYMKRTVEDDKNGTKIDQIFFNDPDGFMIEICNCENLKLVPAGSLGKIKLPIDRHNPPVDMGDNGTDAKSVGFSF